MTLCRDSDFLSDDALCKEETLLPTGDGERGSGDSLVIADLFRQQVFHRADGVGWRAGLKLDGNAGLTKIISLKLNRAAA